MAGLNFDITADNTNIKAKLEETQRKISQMADYAEKEGKNLDIVFSNIGKSIAAIGLGFSAQELGRQIVQVRGEFQQLEVAFKTMLGSEEKAMDLMSQMVETAATTPFDLQSVASGAKQLLAYGENVEKVNDDLVMLGNIAAGLSIPLGDLVYLYGTTMTQGRLYTEDFNQFVGRGIPLISELAKEFGVAENEVKGLVEAGRVGFPEIQKVLENLTSEGGMFFNLMAEQSKTISGQISNIGDSFSMMLNNIGKANEGIINDALSGVSYLLENYESIGKSILELVSAYGAYKAVLITLTALQKAHSVVLQQAALEQSLAAASGIQLSNAQAMAAARTKLLTLSFKSLNATLMANPFALITASIVALGYGIYKIASYQTDFEKGLERLSDSVSEFNTQVVSEQRELARLKGELEGTKKGTSEYNDVKDKIVKGFGKYYDGLEEEIEKVGLTEEAYKKLTNAINQSFGARQYKKFNEEQQGVLDETTAENLEKIQNKLIDKLGVEAGSRYYAKLRDAILQGSLKMGSGYNEILGLDNELKGVLDKVSGKDRKLFYWQDVEKWIKNIITAQDAFDKLDKKAKQRFGIDTTEIIPSSDDAQKTEKTFKTLNEVISAIKEAEKNIADLRSKSQKGIVSTGDVDQALAELETLKKTYKSMTGEDYGKVKTDKTKKELERYYDELIQLAKDNEERRIEIEESGAQKEISLIELRYKRQIDAVKKLQEELKKAQGGKLTEEQQGIFGTAISGLQGMQKSETTAVQDKQLEAERKAMQEYLAEYGDYWEKRKAIAQKYDDEIEKATTKGQKLSLSAEKTDVLAKLDDEAQKKTSIIVKLFGNMADKSVAEMRKIADEAEKLLSFIEGGEYQEDNAFGITEEQFKVLSQSPEKLESIKNEIANVSNEADKLEPTFTKIGNLIKDVLNPENATLGDTLKSLQSEVGSVTQAVSTLANSFAQIGQAFGSDALSAVAEGFNAIGNAANQALSGAISGFVLGGPIGAGIGAVTGMVSSLASTFAKIHDKKNEKRIQRLQDQIDVLTESYDDLGRSVEKAYSKDASKLIEDQNKLLEQQKVLIQGQIAEERDKKDSDEGRIKEWEQQIQDINDAIKDNKQAAIDAIFGEDLQSAIERFSSSLTDAWANGTNASESARDAVKQMMQQMVTESIKSAIQASKSMEQIRQKLQEFYADNILTGWEQDYIYNMAENLQQEIDRQFGWAEGLFQDKTDTSQQATSRGFETMSQDTANELNGRFTAMYEVDLSIRNLVMSMVESISMLSVSVNERNVILSEIRNLMIESNDYLSNMSSLTKKIHILLNEKLASIDNNIKNVL